jgi:hypothetical protein
MRDVQPDFSYIDTVGFQRKEQGLNFAAEWQANDYISIYERFSDLKSDSGPELRLQRLRRLFRLQRRALLLRHAAGAGHCGHRSGDTDGSATTWA